MISIGHVKDPLFKVSWYPNDSVYRPSYAGPSPLTGSAMIELAIVTWTKVIPASTSVLCSTLLNVCVNLYRSPHIVAREVLVPRNSVTVLVSAAASAARGTKVTTTASKQNTVRFIGLPLPLFIQHYPVEIS
jgi:hypothetical protein